MMTANRGTKRVELMYSKKCEEKEKCYNNRKCLISFANNTNRVARETVGAVQTETANKMREYNHHRQKNGTGNQRRLGSVALSTQVNSCKTERTYVRCNNFMRFNFEPFLILKALFLSCFCTLDSSRSGFTTENKWIKKR